MRFDDAGARPWFLAGAAGWAVVAWMLALAGMAGTVHPRPDDPSLVPAVPQLRPPPRERLGPLSQYDQIAARPLFAIDRRPHPFSLQPEGEGEAASSFDYVLTSVLITPQLRMAILQSPDGSQSYRVREGDAPDRTPGWRLVTLGARSAVFEGPEGQRTLLLRTFDGQGGAAPARSTDGAINSPTPPMNIPPGTSVPIVPSPTPSMPSPPIPRPAEIPLPQSPSDPGVAPANSNNNSNSSSASEQAQMEEIRRRIQARREQQRLQQQQQQQPPVK